MSSQQLDGHRRTVGSDCFVDRTHAAAADLGKQGIATNDCARGLG
jgi:hypothetical protein